MPIYLYKDKIIHMKNILESKTNLIILSVIIIIIGLVFIGRLISSEDTWICDDGEWIKHGVPASPKPTTQCGTPSSSRTNSSSNTSVAQWPRNIIPCSERKGGDNSENKKTLDCEADKYCQLVQTGSCPTCADQILKCEPTNL